MRFTFLGKALRAVAQDRETAGLMGINEGLVITLTIVIASALAGMAVYRFGSGPDSRVEHDEQTFSWALTEQIDTYGNSIRYEYFEDAGQIYLERVVYNDYAPEVRSEIVFDYENRADALTSSLSGFRVTTALRLSTITVLHGREPRRTSVGHCSRREPSLGFQQPVRMAPAD
jgi:hypothetical protein